MSFQTSTLTPPQAGRPTGPARVESLTRPENPSWARPAHFGLLAATPLHYLWGLGASGWAHSL